MSARLAPADVLAALRRVRRDEDIVITTMGAAREWMVTGDPHPRDLVFVPSSMGQATSLGLGIALARPDLRVIVCNGDGSMLMNLGSLVTITATGAPNLVVLLFDNGVYEVTGAQPTPAAEVGRAGSRGDAGAGVCSAVDFAAMARAAGFPTVLRYSELDRWKAETREALDAPGPSFIVLDVSATLGAPAPRSPGPAGERARRFMEALGTTAP